MAAGCARAARSRARCGVRRSGYGPRLRPQLPDVRPQVPCHTNSIFSSPCRTRRHPGRGPCVRLRTPSCPQVPRRSQILEGHPASMGSHLAAAGHTALRAQGQTAARVVAARTSPSPKHTQRAGPAGITLSALLPTLPHAGAAYRPRAEPCGQQADDP